ncbi:MAG: thiamine pyrophosphate-binding protein [Pseudomonadales bacterium]|nr:thiamine pyrophosphate-binding protein [Pseudomonadales bacterium]MCP5185455.1 thiamine pyrophosphate-binding protein [Pseudomonadales bacterium]
MSTELLLSDQVRTADAVIQVLEEAGITMVFGIAGGHTGRLFMALSNHQNAVRTVLVREESLGGVMAEVYGRLTGRPGVLIGQGPWVLGNGLIGTLEAHLSSSPMLLLTDFSDNPAHNLHGPYQAGTGGWGTWNARQAFAGVTKQVFEAHEPTAGVQATQFAIKHATTGAPGPVAVLYASGGLSGHVGPDSVPRLYRTPPYLNAPRSADAAEVLAAATLLSSAERPVIIAGNGVRISQAFDELEALAEAWGAPVVTTASGKGTFRENHPLALGVFGTFGIAAANAAVAEADVVLAVGTKLGISDTARANPELLDPTRQQFVQIDIEPRNASWTFPADRVIHGDAAVALRDLGKAFGPDAGRRQKGEARVAGLRKQHGYFSAPEYASPEVPIFPQRVIAALRNVLPDDAIVTCDAGENRILMTHFYQTRCANGFLQAAGSGPMGFGIPAALAAKLVHPDRAVVAVCGDGGFAMTMNGMMTAVEQNIPIVNVVFNNHALGWVLHGGGPFAAEFNDFDHAEIARAMHCHGIRVERPEDLEPALREALASGRPTVVDVVTSLKVSYRDVTSPLAG